MHITPPLSHVANASSTASSLSSSNSSSQVTNTSSSNFRPSTVPSSSFPSTQQQQQQQQQMMHNSLQPNSTAIANNNNNNHLKSNSANSSFRDNLNKSRLWSETSVLHAISPPLPQRGKLKSPLTDRKKEIITADSLGFYEQLQQSPMFQSMNSQQSTPIPLVPEPKVRDKSPTDASFRKGINPQKCYGVKPLSGTAGTMSEIPPRLSARPSTDRFREKVGMPQQQRDRSDAGTSPTRMGGTMATVSSNINTRTRNFSTATVSTTVQQPPMPGSFPWRSVQRIRFRDVGTMTPTYSEMACSTDVSFSCNTHRAKHFGVTTTVSGQLPPEEAKPVEQPKPEPKKVEPTPPLKPAPRDFQADMMKQLAALLGEVTASGSLSDNSFKKKLKRAVDEVLGFADDEKKVEASRLSIMEADKRIQALELELSKIDKISAPKQKVVLDSEIQCEPERNDAALMVGEGNLLETVLTGCHERLLEKKDASLLCKDVIYALAQSVGAEGWAMFHTTKENLILYVCDMGYEHLSGEGKIFPIGKGIIGRFARDEALTWVVKDVPSHPLYEPNVDRRSLSMMCGKIKNIKDELVAVIQLLKFESDDESVMVEDIPRFSSTDTAVVTRVCNQLSVCLGALDIAKESSEEGYNEGLASLSQLLIGCTKLLPIVPKLNDIISRSTQASGCFIWTVDTETNKLITSSDHHQISLELDQGMVAAAMAKKSILNAENCKNFPNASLDDVKYSNALCSSINSSSGNSLGCIQIYNKQSDADGYVQVFSRSDEFFIQRAAKLVGKALERSGADKILDKEDGIKKSAWAAVKETCIVKFESEEVPDVDDPSFLLSQIGPAWRSLIKTNSIEAICSAVMAPCSRKLKASGWTVYRLVGKTWVLTAADANLPQDYAREYPRGKGITDRADVQERALVVKHAAIHEGFDPGMDRNANSIIVARLTLSSGQIVGAINYFKEGIENFHRNDNILVDEVAAQMSGALCMLLCPQIIHRINSVSEGLHASSLVKVANAQSLRETLKAYTGVIRAALDADRCTIWLLDTKNDKLVAKVVDGLSEISMAKNQGLVGAALSQVEPLNIEDCYLDNRFRQAVDKKTGYRTKSMLCFTFLDHKQEPVGVVQVINKNNHEFFDDIDVKVLSNLTSQIVACLERGIICEDRSTLPSLSQLLATSNLLAKSETATVLTASAATPGKKTAKPGTAAAAPKK